VKTEALDSTVIGGVLAGAAGIAVGLGVPIFFSKMEQRDKERVEEIREMNRANLKATGETLPEVTHPTGRVWCCRLFLPQVGRMWLCTSMNSWRMTNTQ
jgi:hypothetical protein